jgi:flavin reductase (DIM6/NTAB) family NADH-FMN oxidoreductase RutF
MKHPDMTAIDPREKDGQYLSRLISSIVIPRPIAWISTISSNGISNLAPFSFFNIVSGDPPTVMISIGQRRGGEPKDTLRNIEDTREFVVNLVDEEHAPAMNHTAADWTHGKSEFDMTGLEPLPSNLVRPPRVAGVPVAMEAKLTQLVPVKSSSNIMVLGQVVYFHIRADLLTPDGLVDSPQMKLVARLGGTGYVRGGEVFHMERPKNMSFTCQSPTISFILQTS